MGEEQRNSSLYDLVVICRTCISECKDYKSLYKEGLICGEVTTLSAILNYCTNLDCKETEESQYLPKYICQACIQDLARSYLFKKKVLDSQEILQAQFEDDQQQDRCLEEERLSIQSENDEKIRFCKILENQTKTDEKSLEITKDIDCKKRVQEAQVSLHIVKRSPRKLEEYVEATDLQELAEVAQLRSDLEQYFDGNEHYVTVSVLDDNESKIIESPNCAINVHTDATVDCQRDMQDVNLNSKNNSDNEVRSVTLPEAYFVSTTNGEIFQASEESQVFEYVVHEESVETTEIYQQDNDMNQQFVHETIITRPDNEAISTNFVEERKRLLLTDEDQVVEEVMQELVELEEDEEKIDEKTEIVELDDNHEYEIHSSDCNDEEEEGEEYGVYIADDEMIETLDENDSLTEEQQEFDDENIEIKKIVNIDDTGLNVKVQKNSAITTTVITRSKSRTNNIEKNGNSESGQWRSKRSNPDFKCKTCGKQLSTQGSYRYHMQLHSDLAPYLCTWCGISFKTRNAYDGHVSIHNPNNPNTCNICGRSYRQAPSLKTHMLTHTGEKPFTCNICGKKLTQKSGYKKHMLIHTGEKPHSCDICGKKFRYSSNMLAHRRCHTGDKPFTCEQCGKCFITSVQAKRHRNVHFHPKNYNCHKCGKSLKSSKTLLAHNKRNKCKVSDINKEKSVLVNKNAENAEVTMDTDTIESKVLESLRDDLENERDLVIEEVVVDDVVGMERTRSRTQQLSNKFKISNVVQIN